MDGTGGRSRDWSVGISVDEHDDRTRATAWLVGDVRNLTGVGVAVRNPRDHDVPEIGDELAVARALSDLAAQLLKVTAGDIEAVTHEHVSALD